MIDITDPRIDSYLLGMLPEPNPQLAAMEQKALASDFPIVGPLVGRFLYLLTRLKEPALVVELGSGFGYSAYWFARALSIRSKVVLIDHDQENIAYAQRVLGETGLSERAEFRTGDAFQVGPQYQDIDILFIDIDKYLYLEALQAMLPRLAKKALVIADNSLWHGRVVEQIPDQDTLGITRFNDFMFSQPDFFTSIVPLRDGVLLALRLM